MLNDSSIVLVVLVDLPSRLLMLLVEVGGVDHQVQVVAAAAAVQGCWTGLEHSINHADGGVSNGYLDRNHHPHDRDDEGELEVLHRLTMMMMKVI